MKDQTVVPVPRHQEIKRGTLMAMIVEDGLTKKGLEIAVVSFKRGEGKLFY